MHLERYLGDREFKRVFKMTPSAFAALGPVKKDKAKSRVHLHAPVSKLAQKSAAIAKSATRDPLAHFANRQKHSSGFI